MHITYRAIIYEFLYILRGTKATSDPCVRSQFRKWAIATQVVVWSTQPGSRQIG